MLYKSLQVEMKLMSVCEMNESVLCSSPWNMKYFYTESFVLL